MGRPKKWVDPLKDREDAMKLRGFRAKKKKLEPKKVKVSPYGKGVITEIPEGVYDYSPGGYIPIPPKGFGKMPFYYDEFGDWDKEALAKILGTDIEPDIKKPPTEDFVDEWYEKNKDV